MVNIDESPAYIAERLRRQVAVEASLQFRVQLLDGSRVAEIAGAKPLGRIVDTIHIERYGVLYPGSWRPGPHLTNTRQKFAWTNLMLTPGEMAAI